jgi:hypothetical protein
MALDKEKKAFKGETIRSPNKIKHANQASPLHV